MLPFLRFLSADPGAPTGGYPQCLAFALAVALAGLLVIGVVAIFARPAIGPGNPTAPPSGLPSTAPSTCRLQFAGAGDVPRPASSTASASPSADSHTISLPMSGETLAAGRYRFDGLRRAFQQSRLPADWKVEPADAAPASASQSASDSHDRPLPRRHRQGLSQIPCHTEDGPTIIGSRPLQALVSAFSYMPGFDVADVTDGDELAGHRARPSQFSNSIDVAKFKCSAENLPIGTYQKDGQDVDVTMFGDESDRFWVLDAGGTTVFTAITDNPQFVQAAEPVVGQQSRSSTGRPRQRPLPQGRPAIWTQRSMSSAIPGYRDRRIPAAWAATPGSC